MKQALNLLIKSRCIQQADDSALLNLFNRLNCILKVESKIIVTWFGLIRIRTFRTPQTTWILWKDRITNVDLDECWTLPIEVVVMLENDAIQFNFVDLGDTKHITMMVHSWIRPRAQKLIEPINKFFESMLERAPLSFVHLT